MAIIEDTRCSVIHDGSERRCSLPNGHSGQHDCCTNTPGAFLDHLQGPALVFLSDDGVAHILDRMPTPDMTSNVEYRHEQISKRDMNILMALWETFYPRWRQR